MRLSRKIHDGHCHCRKDNQESERWTFHKRSSQETAPRRQRSIWMTPFGAQNLHDFFDRAPIAVRSRDAELFFDLPQIADRFHLTTINAENKPALDRDDL